MTPEERYLSNEKLVYDMLKKYFPIYQHNEDMQQEARIGLWKACMSFQDDYGIAFSSYAYRCMRNEVLMALRKENKIISIVSLNQLIDSEDSNIVLEDVLTGDLDVDWVDWEAFCKKLTPLEKDICELRLLGFNQHGIAERLDYTQSYISRALKNVREKFDYYI